MAVTSRSWRDSAPLRRADRTVCGTILTVHRPRPAYMPHGCPAAPFSAALRAAAASQRAPAVLAVPMIVDHHQWRPSRPGRTSIRVGSACTGAGPLRHQSSGSGSCHRRLNRRCVCRADQVEPRPGDSGNETAQRFHACCSGLQYVLLSLVAYMIRRLI